MVQEKKIRLTLILSVIALVCSIIAVCRCEPFELNYFSLIVGLLSFITTIAVGIQIYNAVEANKVIRNSNELTNEITNFIQGKIYYELALVLNNDGYVRFNYSDDKCIELMFLSLYYLSKCKGEYSIDAFDYITKAFDMLNKLFERNKYTKNDDNIELLGKTRNNMKRNHLCMFKKFEETRCLYIQRGATKETTEK